MTDVRTGQSMRTRLRLLESAEELFALHGIAAVSSRQISKFAGQGNNYAVGHHFGNKNGLIEAILARHNELIDRLREEQLALLGPEPGLRDWVRCLVAPQTDYLAALGAPTYFARFAAQVSTDPATTLLLYEKMATSAPLIRIVTGFFASVPPLPEPVLDARNDMTRHLITQSLADHERAMADALIEGITCATTWAQQREITIDALVGLWQAPVTNS